MLGKDKQAETVAPLHSVTMDLETAEAEFDRFVSIWQIDGDVDTMTEDDRDGFLDHKRKLVRAIRSGQLALSDDGAVTVKLISTTLLEMTELVLRVPVGGAMLTWDKTKESENVKKMTSMLAHMSGQNPAIFAKIDMRDLKPAMAVATLFLAS